MNSESTIEFFTHKMCPYAQRVWIALEHHGVEYKLTEIDLYGHKPQWFLKLNPKGLVPVIRYGDVVVTESNDILNFLEETFSSESHQDDGWFDFINQRLGPTAKRFRQSGRGKENFARVILEMEEKIIGPYLCGDELCNADFSMIPFLQRIYDHDLMKNLVNQSDIPKLDAYAKAVFSSDCFRATIVSPYWWWW